MPTSPPTGRRLRGQRSHARAGVRTGIRTGARAMIRAGIRAGLLALALLAGCERGAPPPGLELRVLDPAGVPLADVDVFHAADGDSVLIGRTDAAGVLRLQAADLQPLPATLHLRGPRTTSTPTTRVDAEACELIVEAERGVYATGPDGLRIAADDLARVPAARTVRLSFGDGGLPDAGPEPLERRSLAVTIPIETTPGATVRLGQEPAREADRDGRLELSYCPLAGDGSIRTAVDVEIGKAGHETWRTRLTIPATGDPPPVRHTLRERAGEPGPAPAPDPDPDPALVQVRVVNLAPPRSCGPEGTELPVLLINSESTRIRGVSPDAMGFTQRYDVLLTPGQQYCLAVACPDDPAADSAWNPWDPGGPDRKRWFRLTVPPQARRLLVEIGPDQRAEPGLPAQEESALPGFDAARAPTIARGCGR